MLINDNGITREMTEEEITEFEKDKKMNPPIESEEFIDG